jgi:hypothetical protein
MAFDSKIWRGKRCFDKRRTFGGELPESGPTAFRGIESFKVSCNGNLAVNQAD